MKNKIYDYIITIVIILVSFPIMFLLGILTFIIIVLFPSKTRLFLYVFSNIFILMFGILIKNKGTFPLGGPYIFIANHSSFIDYILIVIVMGYKRKWTVVYGNNLNKYPIFKFFLKKVGISVDRKNTLSKLEATELMKKVLIEGFSLAIFPEGTRMRSFQINEILLPFKNGAFSVSIDLKIPIAPVVFLRPILYSKPDKPFPFSPRKITIKYFDLIKGEENRIILKDKAFKIMKDYLENNP